MFRLEELAARIEARVVGDPAREIRGVATLDEAGPEHLSFFTNPRYREAARASRAGALLCKPGSDVGQCDRLESTVPYVALARVLELFHPSPPIEAGVSPDARIGSDVSLGRGVRIEPFAVIGDRVELGAGTVVGSGAVIGAGCSLGEATELRPAVVLYPGTRIGRRCLVHSGVVLGADGFGFAQTPDGHLKVPQVGTVVVEDDVEIGANCAIDRAMLGSTRIGSGSKIDDLVMLAHGVQIGRDSLLVAQSGVAGSARLGRGSVVAGQSGIAGHLRVGERVQVAAKSAVFDDQPDGAFVSGVPAFDHRNWRRSQALFRRLPELRRELRELRRRVERLEDGLGDDEE